MDKVYYNHFANGLISCPEENLICPRCKGLGYHQEHDNCEFSIQEDDVWSCYLCKGLGHIDWITNVMQAGWKQWEEAMIEAEEAHADCLNDISDAFI